MAFAQTGRTLAVAITLCLGGQIGHSLDVYGWAFNLKGLWQGSANFPNDQLPPLPFTSTPTAVPIDVASEVGSSYVLTDRGEIIACGEVPSTFSQGSSVFSNHLPGNPWQWLGRNLATGASGMPQFVESKGSRLSSIIELAKPDKARAYHMLALSVDGTPWAWGGTSANGQNTIAQRLATGVVNNTATQSGFWTGPLPVLQNNGATSRLNRIKAIAVSTWMGIGLKANGEVLAWGWPHYLGWPPNTFTYPLDWAGPVSGAWYFSNPSIARAKAVDGGGEHYGILTSDGQVYCWGDNKHGQCGQPLAPPNQSTAIPAPTKVNFLPAVVFIKQISLGYTHTMALDSRGNVWVWGDDDDGECAQSPAPNKVVVSPYQVPSSNFNGVPAMSVHAGVNCSFVTLTSGELWGWGTTIDRELAIVGANHDLPMRLPPLSENHDILSGSFSEPCLAIRASGQANLMGEHAGLRTHTSANSRRGIRKLAFGASINLPGCDSYAIDSQGDFCYGNYLTGIMTPVVIPTQAGYIDIAVAGASVLLLKGDGSLWFYGNGSAYGFGSVSTPTMIISNMNGRAIGIELSKATATVLRDDGTVWTRGATLAATFGNPNPSTSVWNQVVSDASGSTPLTQIIDISSSDRHTVALMANGTVYGWGDNTYGQAGTPISTQFFDYAVLKNSLQQGETKAIAAGNGFTVTLRSDGTVWSYGKNNHGQLGNAPYPYPLGGWTHPNSDLPVQASDITAGSSKWTPLRAKKISAGADVAAYLLANGTIKAAGSDSSDIFAPAGPTHDKNMPTSVSKDRFYELAIVGSFHNRVGGIGP